MNASAFKFVCRILIASMLVLSFPSAQAGMIGTGQSLAAGAQAERAAVLGALERAEVSGQLAAMGVDPQAARERVASLTDREARALAGSIESVPAGAYSGWAVAVLIAILVAAYYYAWK